MLSCSSKKRVRRERESEKGGRRDCKDEEEKRRRRVETVGSRRVESETNEMGKGWRRIGGKRRDAQTRKGEGKEGDSRSGRRRRRRRLRRALGRESPSAGSERGIARIGAVAPSAKKKTGLRGKTAAGGTWEGGTRPEND